MATNSIFEERTTGPQELQRVYAKIEVDYPIDELQIKEKLAYLLVKEIYKNGFIRFSKDAKTYDPLAPDIYKAEMTLAPLNYTHGLVTEDVFIHKGYEFNIDELREAVENTYPERFI